MKKSLAPVFFVLSISFLTACGKDSNGSGNKNNSFQPRLEEQQTEGSYRAILRPFNNSLSGFLPTGAAEVSINGDTVSVKTYLDDDARTSHLQSIHTGTRCPQLSDDKNRDGLIDINESYAVTGKVLVPLDADINTAVDGQGIYPTGGGFTYMEQASLSKLESDVKARMRQNLNLGGRVVLIHGVASKTTMLSTVATRDGLPVQSSIPVACGILRRQ